MHRSLQTTVFRAPVTTIQFVTGTKRLSAPSIFFGDQKTTPFSQSRHRALPKFSPVFVSVQESGTNAEEFVSCNPEADLVYKKPTGYAPCVYQHIWLPVITSGEPSFEISSVRGWCSPIRTFPDPGQTCGECAVRYLLEESIRRWGAQTPPRRSTSPTQQSPEKSPAPPRARRTRR